MKFSQILTVFAVVAVSAVSSVYADDTTDSGVLAVPPDVPAYQDSGATDSGSTLPQHYRRFGLQRDRFGSGTLDASGQQFSPDESSSLDSSGQQLPPPDGSGAMMGSGMKMHHRSMYDSGTLDASGSSFDGYKHQKTASFTLPASVSTALDARLATFSDTGSQATWLQSVSDKITALLAQTSNSTQLQNALSALQDLIQEKIANISQAADTTDSTLTNLLN